MSVRIRSSLLAMIFSLGAVSPAEARRLSCDSIFQISVNEVLLEIDRNTRDGLFQGKNFEEYTQSFSWLRKRKIRGLVKDINVSGFPSEKAVGRYTIELSEALFGNSSNLRRWIRKSAEEGLKDSDILRAKEQIILHGMLNTWKEVHNPQQVSALKNFLDKLSTFSNSYPGQTLRLPFRLPKIRDQKISDELMTKIIRDGFEAHAEEVRMALNHQTKIDAYNTFRKVYAPTFFLVVFAIQVINAYEEIQDKLEAQAKEAVEQLRTQTKYLEQAIPQIKQEQFEMAYAAAVTEFKNKWGEPPTPQEEALLKAKIEKALKMN